MSTRADKSAAEHAPEATAGAGQAAFVAALLDPSAPTPEGVVGRPKKRFDVYRNNVLASLIDALGKAYPAVRALVGDAFFQAAAGVFVRAHPPRTPVMIYYGEGFADWLEAFEPAQGLVYLPDVARLERLLLEATHAADATPLDRAGFAAAVADLDPDALAERRLTPHPAARALASRYPVVSLRERALRGGSGALSGAETALVSRPDIDVSCRRAPTGTAAALAGAAAGETLGAAAEAAAAEGGDFAEVLTALMEAGAIAAIDAPAN